MYFLTIIIYSSNVARDLNFKGGNVRKSLKFLCHLNTKIQEQVDKNTSRNRGSLFKLILYEIYAYTVIFCTVGCIAGSMYFIWRPDGFYPFYLIPAVLSPYTIVWSYHQIRFANWYIANR